LEKNSNNFLKDRRETVINIRKERTAIITDDMMHRTGKDINLKTDEST
jgi:hypothetical protein